MSNQTSSNVIPGLKFYELQVHSDSRGWFRENWRSTQTSSEHSSFIPVQNNISFNSDVGVTRGFHAEPWDKYISVTSGKVFGAWVDLRKGDSFGQVFHAEVNPSQSVFVPAGVANAFQTLEKDTTYVYLVNGSWDKSAMYVSISLFDPSLGIPWPIPSDESTVSNKDLQNPLLSEIEPFAGPEILVSGSNGQLGRAIVNQIVTSAGLTKSQFNITDVKAKLPLSGLAPSWLVNAAAYTNVDASETSEGFTHAWQTNVQGSANLVKICQDMNMGLVSFSSDYVFDGSFGEYSEEMPPMPLNNYGLSKAAGDAVVSTLKRHYILRTSWVVGEGANFVATMRTKALAGEKVQVVTDQIGRLTFAEDLAAATYALIGSSAPYGTYNVTNSGPAVSWFELARTIYLDLGVDPSLVSGLSSDEYQRLFPNRAKRPKFSTLTTKKFVSNTGHSLPDWRISLQSYLDSFK